MTISKSPASYEDCYRIMERALDDEHGLRIRFAMESDAIFFRMRCHQARALDRAKNADTYEKGHPLHNTTPTDCLILRIHEVDKAWWVYMEKIAIVAGAVESLTTGENLEFDLPKALPKPPKQIAPPQAPSADEMADALNDIVPVPHDGEILPPKSGFRRL